MLYNKFMLQAAYNDKVWKKNAVLTEHYHDYADD